MEKGYSVKAIRRSHKLPGFLPVVLFEKVEWVEGDLFDISLLEEAMKGTNAIVHAAAMVSFSSKEHAAMLKTNIEGTANVVNAALNTGVPRMLHVSSVAAMGRTANGEHVTEKKQWEDSAINTTYAISKYTAELEVWRGIGEGLDAVIINPSTILGYGDWNNSSCAIFKNAYNEFPWYSNGVNGFVAVEDVAKAAVLLLESNISNERFIVNADNWSFKQVFDCMADAFGKKRPHREATPFLSAMAWRIEKVKSVFSGKPTLLTKETARIAQTATYFDNSKICSVLPGFNFMALDDCINNACNHYLQYK